MEIDIPSCLQEKVLSPGSACQGVPADDDPLVSVADKASNPYSWQSALVTVQAFEDLATSPAPLLVASRLNQAKPTRQTWFIFVKVLW